VDREPHGPDGDAAGADPYVVHVFNSTNPYTIPALTCRGMADAGFPMDTLVLQRFTRDRRTGRGLLALRRRLRELGPDIVHVHAGKTGLAAVSVTRTDSRMQLALTNHTPQSRLAPPSRAARGLLLSAADLVVSNSQVTQDSLSWVERRLAGRAQLEVVHNGVPVEEIPIKPPPPPPEIEGLDSEGRFLLGSAGRLIPTKGYQTAVRAVSELADRGVEVDLLVLGDGPERDRLRSLARETDVGDRVHLPGTVPRQRVYAVLHHLDAFVMPSRTEGFCNALVEAMIVGKPCIVSDIPTFHEVAGDTGSFFEPDDPASLASTVEHLHRNPSEAESLARRARERARDRFTLERTVARHIELYRCLADS